MNLEQKMLYDLKIRNANYQLQLQFFTRLPDLGISSVCSSPVCMCAVSSPVCGSSVCSSPVCSLPVCVCGKF